MKKPVINCVYYVNHFRRKLIFFFDFSFLDGMFISSIFLSYGTAYIKQVTFVFTLVLTVNNFLKNYNRLLPVFYFSSIGILRKKLNSQLQSFPRDIY